MEQSTARLGWALAHLQTEKNLSALQVSEADSDYLRYMRERYRQLSRDGKLIAVLEKLPDRPCLMNHPFLEGNEDFFIALFSKTKHDEACIRLYKHMNDCYRCFEIFSQVLRDYYRQGEALHAVKGEKQDG